MRRTCYIVFVLMSVTFLGLWGCSSDRDKVDRVAKNFVLADFVYAAPYRSYLFVSSADKEAMTIEEYAAWHDRPKLPESTEVTVGEPVIEGDRAEALVRLDEGRQSLVLIREDGRWRVHLGLREHLLVRQRIETARRHRAEGDLDSALQELVQAEMTQADATLGEELNDEVALLRSEIEDEEQAAMIEKRIGTAQTAPLTQLDDLLADLRKLATAPKWREQIEELETRRAELRLTAAREGLVLEDSKIRRFYEGSAIVHELDATLVNNSQVPIANAKLAVEMLQSGDSLGTRVLAAPLGEGLAPGAENSFTLRIPNTEIEWKSREFNGRFTEVEVADD